MKEKASDGREERRKGKGEGKGEERKSNERDVKKGEGVERDKKRER